jgi:general nucleoside transport system permease protein
MEHWLDYVQIADFSGSALRLAIPIGFAALGGVLSERGGIINVGLEGMMLTGAFGAAVGSYFSGSAAIGLLAAVAAGALAGLLLSVLAVTLRVNQLVAGIAVNLLCLGLTAFLARLVFGSNLGHAFVAGFKPLPLPLLSTIPLVGSILFNQDCIAYALYCLTPLTAWLLYRTEWGLNLRGTGENPKAADTAGVAVFEMRYHATILSGVFAALGGAHIVLSQIFLFTEGMSAGKGYIALAAVILGRWNPILAVAAALFFGVCDAAQLRLQFSSPTIPYQGFVILPYVASILALVVLAKSSSQPEALGAPYDRERR